METIIRHVKYVKCMKFEKLRNFKEFVYSKM